MAGRSSKRSDGEKLDRALFEPRSLAVIGASSHREKVGYSVLANIIASGYTGEIYPVNPHGARIQGLKAYRGLDSLPAPPDLAIIIVPAAAVPRVVSECVDMGTRHGIVISAGFREAGIEGRRLERETVQLARRGGMRLLGPNCLGMMNTSLPLNASFARLMPPKGSIGVVSQSGAICTFLLDWARAEGVGFSKLISLGNSADLVESDFIELLADDEETSVISMYLEGISRGERFFKVLKKAARRKPVIVLKAGTTQAGARAASSHTGALAGSESACNAVCEQTPALRAGSVEELVELSRAFATQSAPGGPRVAIVTNAGGPGIIAADACERAGMALARLSGKTVERLRPRLPAASSLHNPVDVLGDATALRYSLAVGAMMEDRNVDAVMVILTPQAMTDIEGTAKEIVRLKSGSGKTIICCFMGVESVKGAVATLQGAGIPNVTYPDEAVRVLSRMYERTLKMKRKSSRPERFAVDSKRVGSMFESYHERGLSQVGPEDCREVLGAYGIEHVPFKLATDLNEAKRLARQIGYPLALKVVSPQILHKTDIGGVVLGVTGPRALENAYEDIIYRVRRHMPFAEIYGIGLQKMVPPGKELILGMVKDSQFGPMIMVGLGGIYVEAFKDVSFRLAPIGPEEAARMLSELKAFRLLKGVRGEQPSDVEAVEEVLLRVSQLAVEHPALSEMDINPLMVYNAGDSCTCVDVRMTLGG